jgi:glycosyltransferase involved in cell wall biosynthesis
MLVSVVIPLYNKVRHIQRAIDSVLAQTIADFELIVVDDGSTDGGADVVAGCADPRVRLVRQTNVGVSAARNRGIDEAAGQLVAFLDADDQWLPCFLETVLALWRRYPNAGAFATAYESYRNDKQQCPSFTTHVEIADGGLLPDYFLAACDEPPVCSSAVMIPKSVFDAIGGFPVGMKHSEDSHMWARIALHYPIAWSPRVGAIYYFNADNRACANVPMYLDALLAPPIEEFLASGAKPVSPRQSIVEYLAFCRLELARDLCAAGMTQEAAELVRKAACTKRYRKQRLLLQCSLCVPSWLFTPLRKARRSCITFRQRILNKQCR